LDISTARIIRLNATLFPVSDVEWEKYHQFGLKPLLTESKGLDILKAAGDCSALLVVSESLDAEVLRGLQDCKVISRLGTGTDKIDVATATELGILVTNIPDFCVEEQADHTMAMLLGLVRKIPKMQVAMACGHWRESRMLSSTNPRLQDRVLGLIGFGGSAKAVTRRAQSFGLRVIACRRQAGSSFPDSKALGVEILSLDEVLQQSDFLSLHLPLNPETNLLLNRNKLEQMKRGSLLINTSRGGLVDELALVEMLRDGHLAGAGLDTFSGINVHAPEEGPPEHPLLALENVILTPHVAAYSEEAMRDVAVGGVENVVSVLQGKLPPSAHIVNPSVIGRNPRLYH
jgi:D-3-phosphoglycerate dehydrogenase